MTTAGSVLRDRYHLDQNIGTGATATVWSATDTVLGRRVAVKVLHPHLRADPVIAARFHREAIAAGRLTHPHIVTVYDTVETDDVEAIVMELVDGSSLRAWLDRVGSLPAPVVTRFCSELLGALAHAHERGVIHRDVKPANILITLDGRAKLTDFGIARAVDDAAMTGTGLLIGTASYLSPEQVEGADLDGRTDLYSLAIVAFEALVGHAPWSGQTSASVALARLREAPPRADAANPTIPRGLADVIEVAMARHNADRFPDAESFERAIDAGHLMDRADPNPPTVYSTPTPAGTDRRSPPADAPPSAKAIESDRRSRVGLAMLISLVVGSLVVLVALIAPQNSRSGDPSPTAQGAPIAVHAVTTFDPGGTGVPGENDSSVSSIVDGDTATSWRTESYDERTFGIKAGVGVVVDLGTAHRVDRLEVTSESDDWMIDVFAGDDPDRLDAAGTPVVSGQVMGPVTSVELGGIEAHALLVWIRRLGAGAPRYRVVIDEIAVIGS